MSGKTKFLDFINGKPGAPMPAMPILMRFAAEYTRTPYAKFVLDVEAHCQANIKCAQAFGSDWVNVMSDPYAEAESWGVKIEYPENNLPMCLGELTFEEMTALPELNLQSPRIQDRINQIKRFKELSPHDLLVCGWVEGPIAEFCDLRGMGDAFLDFYDEPEKVKKAIRNFVDSAKKFITLQVQAGADCIGIGDAACSQIGTDLYKEFAFAGECELVSHIHSLGALAKLHICGNTTSVLPEMIATKADIIDIDHAVSNMADFTGLLNAGQVFCGNLDPVGVIFNQSAAGIRERKNAIIKSGNAKIIVSGGCEIPPGTPSENLLALTE